ncbi:Nif3-like dinuclear metal center hexameric protein [Desulfocurvus sp. DL9XJH121]
MNVQNVIACIEHIAPPEGQADWDNSGVQIAGLCEDVARLAVTIDPSPRAVAAALDWGADMVLTHHPLYRSPLPLSRPGYFLDTARAVLSAGAWLYAAHTSLDVQSAGPAGWLARELGLAHCAVLEPTDPGDPGAGFGLAGALPEAMPWKDFAVRLGQAVERDFWTLSGETPQTVGRVAYCTGSGSSLMDAAALAGADVFVTGDMKYHQALESPQFTVDVGHFSLEERMTRELADLVADQLGKEGVKVRFFPGLEPFTVHRPVKI